MKTLTPRPHRPRHGSSAGRADPLYGYDYNPAWPSILAVAHDEANGGRVFVFTDRPCALVSTSAAGLPLSFPADSSLVIVDAVEVLPKKFRLWFSGPVPAGTMWRWAADGLGLIDPITGHVLNAAGGSCADVPGPFSPAPPAHVVDAYASGTTAVVQFSRSVSLNVNPTDDAITFNGMTPGSVQSIAADTLSFGLPGFAMSGDPWVVSAQPGYLDTPILWPASGIL